MTKRDYHKHRNLFGDPLGADLTGELLGLNGDADSCDIIQQDQQQQRQKQAGTVPTEGAEPRINPFGGFHFDSPPLSEEERGRGWESKPSGGSVRAGRCLA